MTHELECPNCDAIGTLTPSLYASDFKHDQGTVHVVDLECYICSQCGSDPVFADQARRNHARITDARRAAYGLLTGAEIRALRERFSLSQQEAATLFGGGANAFSKYERGEVTQSDAMDRLMKIVAGYPFLLDSLRMLAGVPVKPFTGLAGMTWLSESAVAMNDSPAPQYRRHGGLVAVSSSEYARA